MDHNRQARMHTDKRDGGGGVVYRNPRCQWQGTSRRDCQESYETLTVVATGLVPVTARVSVCTGHVIAYRKQLQTHGMTERRETR